MNTDGLGNLALAVLLPGGAKPILGDINYQDSDWYTTTAGIQQFNLTDSELSAVEAHPLAIVRVNASGENEILIQENSIGAFVRADKFVFRLNPGEEAEVQLYATVFGKPAANQLITLVQDPASVNNMQSPPNPDSIPIGTPPSALQMPSTVTTDAQGRASFKLTASDPGNPRQFIDGQVYGVRYIWGEQEPPDYNHDPTSFVSVLAHDSYTYEDPLTWTINVEPILGQYAKLYPYMTDNIVNLGNYKDVVSQKESIKRVLSIPKGDPGYMQVTRDMSRDKLQMILKWLDNPIQ